MTKNFEYRAVTVSACNESCAAAKTHSGKKLLLDQFDKLILRFCLNRICSCNFEQHKDRRSGLDRRYLPKNKAHPIIANNHRMSYGRRTGDVHNKARDRSGEVDLSKVIYEFFYVKD